MRWLLCPLVALGTACAPSMAVQVVRSGPLVEAQPADCGAQIEDMDISVAMNKLQQVGMVVITGETKFTSKVKKRVLEEACGLGGSSVVFNASISMGGGMQQFMVFRQRPDDPNHAAPMDQLGAAIAKALGRDQALPEAPIPDAAVVAVLDIEDASGVLNPEANASLTDALSTLLAESERFKVIPGKDTRTRLNKIAADSYRVQHDEATQVELGKATAANKTLSTKLIKADDRCALSSILFDVEKQTSESAATVTGACSTGALLGNLPGLVKKLDG